MYIPQLVGEWSLSVSEWNWSQRGHSTQSFLVIALVVNRLVQLPIACIEDVTMFANAHQLLAGQKAMLNSVLQFSQFCDCSVSSKCLRASWCLPWKSGQLWQSAGDQSYYKEVFFATKFTLWLPATICKLVEEYTGHPPSLWLGSLTSLQACITGAFTINLTLTSISSNHLPVCQGVHIFPCWWLLDVDLPTVPSLVPNWLKI